MKRRWVVEWVGEATMYGYRLVVGDPVYARTWLRSSAERARTRLEAEHLVSEGTQGKWAVRRA